MHQRCAGSGRGETRFDATTRLFLFGYDNQVKTQEKRKAIWLLPEDWHRETLSETGQGQGGRCGTLQVAALQIGGETRT